MMKFAGTNKLDDICLTMKTKGMKIDTFDLKNGGDWCYFKGSWFHIPVTIAYNTTNGSFTVHNGFTGKQIATHLTESLDSEEWYRELLNVFYKVA